MYLRLSFIKFLCNVLVDRDNNIIIFNKCFVMLTLVLFSSVTNLKRVEHKIYFNGNVRITFLSVKSEVTIFELLHIAHMKFLFGCSHTYIT